MTRIADNLTELVGNTPLLRLTGFCGHLQADLLAKLEYFNPAGSVKDRIGYAMITAAEEQGLIPSAWRGGSCLPPLGRSWC